MYYRSN